MSAGHLRPFIPGWLDDLDLRPAAWRVLGHLWRRADKLDTCFPSGRSIARACHLHRDTVWEALAELEEKGHLKRGKGRRNSNLYQLLRPAPVGGNQGPSQPSEMAELKGQQLAESEGQHLAETKGQQLEEKKGHKGMPFNQPREPKPMRGGAATPWPMALSPEQQAAILDGHHDLSAEKLTNCYPAIRDELVRWKVAFDDAGFSELRDKLRNVKCPDHRQVSTKYAALLDGGIPEPEGWKAAIADDDELERFASRDWYTIHRHYQERIVAAIERRKARIAG